MDELTKKYHEATKVTEVEVSLPEEAPVTWTKIFYKQYPRLSSKKLKTNDIDGELEDLLRNRKSVREFENNALSFDMLSSLLLNGLGRVHPKSQRRAYPSAGARFPVETYIIAFNVAGLNPGVYHFDVKDEKLEILLEEDLTHISEVFHSPYISSPSAVFIFTAVIPRSEIKYGINAYKFSLIEAGHMAQNLSLLCTKYNIGGCSVAGIIHDVVSETLDLIPEEVPIYAFACGNPKNE